MQSESNKINNATADTFLTVHRNSRLLNGDVIEWHIKNA